mmetsp:Transcript_25114/g.65291  ORF Transcript_25114/g.65291 Transcript_25114/m.65291 type:complete len:205 (+) Transcript_25114:268-882(+)
MAARCSSRVSCRSWSATSSSWCMTYHCITARIIPFLIWPRTSRKHSTSSTSNAPPLWANPSVASWRNTWPWNTLHELRRWFYFLHSQKPSSQLSSSSSSTSSSRSSSSWDGRFPAWPRRSSPKFLQATSSKRPSRPGRAASSSRRRPGRTTRASCKGLKSWLRWTSRTACRISRRPCCSSGAPMIHSRAIPQLGSGPCYAASTS